MTILYIDDDREDQKIFVEAVAAVNPRVTCHLANDGFHALEILNDLILIPDYIFLDINMPRLTGKQFLIELKRSKKFNDVDVVMYSTSTNPKDLSDCKKLGAKDFIIKPNNFSAVCDALKNVIV